MVMCRIAHKAQEVSAAHKWHFDLLGGATNAPFRSHLQQAAGWS